MLMTVFFFLCLVQEDTLKHLWSRGGCFHDEQAADMFNTWNNTADLFLMHLRNIRDF